MQFLSLEPLRQSLADALSIPLDRVECEVFACRQPSGSSLHADRDINLQLQLYGSKRWAVAPNPQCAAPIKMCVPGSPVPGKQETFPLKMPLAGRRTAQVGPGGAVFLPRGWWHETATDGASLGLNLVIKGPTIADLVLGELRDALHTQPRWRRLTAETNVRAPKDLDTQMRKDLRDALQQAIQDREMQSNSKSSTL